MDSSGGAHEEQLYKLVPLKDGLAVAQQNMQEVRVPCHNNMVTNTMLMTLLFPNTHTHFYKGD